jgi:hypothetical protein
MLGAGVIVASVSWFAQDIPGLNRFGTLSPRCQVWFLGVKTFWHAPVLWYWGWNPRPLPPEPCFHFCFGVRTGFVLTGFELELEILLPDLQSSWDCRCMLPCLFFWWEWGF